MRSSSAARLSAIIALASASNAVRASAIAAFISSRVLARSRARAAPTRRQPGRHRRVSFFASPRRGIDVSDCAGRLSPARLKDDLQ